MSLPVHRIDQRYWRHASCPHIELRQTEDSTQGYKAHRHDSLSIGLIDAGQTELTCGAEKFVISTDEIIVLPPELVHACNPVNDMPRSYHMLYIAAEWCHRMLSDLYQTPVLSLGTNATRIHDPILACHLRQAVDTLTTAENDNASADLDRLLVQILGLSYAPEQQDASASPMAESIRHRLLSDLIAPPSLDDLAQEQSCTVEALIRTFRRAYGITPKAFLNNVRIETAKHLLRGGATLVEAALDVGFADQSQFHKAFVTYTAATPGQYRQGSISDKTGDTTPQ